jgi:hypothetical protein
MADQADVETVLTTLVNAAVYPNGTGAPSITGAVCRIYRGWPNSAALNADLAARRVNITVFPDARNQHNTTRWPNELAITTPATPTLTITATMVGSNATATIGGTAGLGQVAGLLVDDLAVVHRTAVGDTPDLVAATLGTYLRSARIATVTGATITVPGAHLVVGRVVADQQVQTQIRRQRQNFRISCWCPDPASRDAIAAAVDGALAAENFITLPDGTSGRLRFVSSSVFDQSQDASLYRRDLLYGVDYATTQTLTLPSMIFGDAQLSPDGAGIVQSLLG